MYLIQVYFILGTNLQIFFGISEFFIDPAHYKEKQSSENIQRVNMIRLNLKANYISLGITRNILYFNCAKSR